MLEKDGKMKLFLGLSNHKILSKIKRTDQKIVWVSAITLETDSFVNSSLRPEFFTIQQNIRLVPSKGICPRQI